MNKRFEPVLSELWQPIEIVKLRFWSWCGCAEPIAEVCLAMHAKRRAERVAVLAILKTILTREDLDALFEVAAFHRNSEAQGQVVNVDAELRGQQWFGSEYPEVTAAA